MKIEYERSGGFAGLTTTATFDTDTLSEPEREALCGLVEGAGFFDLPPEFVDAQPGADQFTYTVTVHADNRVNTVTTSESAAPPPLRDLLHWLGRAARRGRGGPTG